MIRVTLPAHLRKIAGTSEEVEVQVDGKITQYSILDALERDYPMLKGTIRNYGTLKRRPFLRFFAAGTDISLDPCDIPLPAEIENGSEPFMIVGAIAGG
jgi:molybdopterin converting factor small subunit